MARKISKYRFRSGMFAMGCCLALSACENPWIEDAPSLDTILSRGWLFGDTTTATPPSAAQPVYCYETIGVGDCHDQPLSDGGNRLIGFEGPEPLPARP